MPLCAKISQRNTKLLYHHIPGNYWTLIGCITYITAFLEIECQNCVSVVSLLNPIRYSTLPRPILICRTVCTSIAIHWIGWHEILGECISTKDGYVEDLPLQHMTWGLYGVFTGVVHCSIVSVGWWIIGRWYCQVRTWKEEKGVGVSR